MTFNAKLENELKRFLAEPDAYMDPKSYTYQEVNANTYLVRAERVMALMDYTNFSPEVMTNIVNYCSIEPKAILNAIGNDHTKVRMLEATYLQENSGLGEVTLCDYFLFSYDNNKEQLDTEHMLLLLSKLISRLTENRDNEFRVDTSHVVESLSTVIIDMSHYLHAGTCEESLIQILPMFWFMEQTSSDKVMPELVEAMRKYAEIVYGTKVESIIKMAELLDMSGNVDFWKSALTREPSTDYVLPSL